MATDDLNYFRARAIKAREMAAAATDPAIKRIHTQMAIGYEQQSEKLAFAAIRARARRSA